MSSRLPEHLQEIRYSAHFPAAGDLDKRSSGLCQVHLPKQSLPPTDIAFVGGYLEDHSLLAGPPCEMSTLSITSPLEIEAASPVYRLKSLRRAAMSAVHTLRRNAQTCLSRLVGHHSDHPCNSVEKESSH